MVYNKQIWKDEIPDLTRPIKDASGKQKADPQTGRPLYELVQEGTRITSERLNHIEDGIEIGHEQIEEISEEADAHVSDVNRHLTAAERVTWNAKETPVGAQQKVDASLASAKSYTDTQLLTKVDKSSIYTKSETDQRIEAVVGAAPDALDTLKEIGDALNNDPNFAATITTQLAGKVDKVSGKQLSTEDYSTAEKTKLAGLTSGAGGSSSATDTVIGNRTITDTTAPTGDTAAPTTLFGWLGNMIKSITGGATWRTVPGMTIAAIKTILDAAVSIATPSTLIKRDAAGRAQVVAPSAAGDIAIRATVDAAIITASGDATTKANTAQAAAIAAAATDATNKDTALQGAINTALALKAPLANPALTGVPTAPTAAFGTSSPQLATTAFVRNNAPKRVLLNGQVQATSYYRSVIALCDLTNTNPSANSYSNGLLTMHRANGLTGQVTALVSGEKRYNTTTMNYSTLRIGTGATTFRPCTFTYGGIKYGGIDLYISDAEFADVEFNGATNFGIFGVDYYNTQTSGVLNTEVYNSLNTTNDFTLVNDFNYNGTIVPTVASPSFIGTPTAPTAANGTNTTQLANTAFVQAAIALLISSAPGALDTLNELAAAMGDDPNFAATVTNALALKLNISAYTAADVLTKLKTVGGVGSGLDADTLRGFLIDQNVRTTDSPVFNGVKFNRADNYKLGADLPSTYPLGETIFFCNNVAGFPAMYGTVVTFRGYTSMAAMQYFYPYNADAPVKYRYAIYPNDAWLAWRDLIDSTSYTAANVLAKLLTVDGAGSGVDADTLDTYHAATIVQGTLGYAGTTTGTSTAYVVTLSPAAAALTTGLRLSFKAHIASGTSPTLNVNALGVKSIRKPNGISAVLALSGVYTVIYDGTAFILQGEGGEYGTATAAQVLTGYNIGTDSGLVNGAMPRRTGGEYGGYERAQAILAAAGRIHLYGPLGGYVDPTADAGGGHFGIFYDDPNFIAANFRSDKNVLGMQGSLPVITAGADPAIGLGQWADGGLAVYPSEGYRKGGAGAGEIKVSVAQLQATVSGLTAANIRSGVPLMGLTGTLVEGKKFASGTMTITNGSGTVSGLAFQPDSIDYYSTSANQSVGMKGSALGSGIPDRFSSNVWGSAEYVLTPITNGFTLAIPYAINATFWWRAWS